MNKYTIRRFFLSIITVPLAYTSYLVLWVVLIALGAEGRFADFQQNLPTIAVAWVVGWTFIPDVERFIERREALRD